MEARKAFRDMLNKRQMIVAPSVLDPLTALIAQSLGYKAVCMGGSITGWSRGVPEPMLTMSENVEEAALITRAVNLPVLADADAGFGDALHTMRTVREFELAGVASIQIEDQIFPKRASYFRGLEHVVSLEEYLEKIRAAMEARKDPDMVIIARSDASRAVKDVNLPNGPSIMEEIRRAQACLEIGVDAIHLHPKNVEELQIIVRELPGVIQQVSGFISRKDAAANGVAMLCNPRVGMNAALDAVTDAYNKWMEVGEFDMSPKAIAAREKVQELVGLHEHWKIEDATTENPRRFHRPSH